jgi:hypothetical protein
LGCPEFARPPGAEVADEHRRARGHQPQNQLPYSRRRQTRLRPIEIVGHRQQSQQQDQGVNAGPDRARHDPRRRGPGAARRRRRDALQAFDHAARQQTGQGQGRRQRRGHDPNLAGHPAHRFGEFRPAVPADQPPGTRRPDGQPDEEAGERRRREAAVVLRLVGRRSGHAEDRVKPPGTQEPPRQHAEDVSAQERAQHHRDVQRVPANLGIQVLPPG